ncbi:MAG: RrF2 family transcriptional regulator, partial [Dolichospermum sp.]
IAAKQPIPERYLEQILAQLRRAGLVQSQRGSKGGFVLMNDPWQITVLEIVTWINAVNVTITIITPNNRSNRLSM